MRGKSKIWLQNSVALFKHGMRSDWRSLWAVALFLCVFGQSSCQREPKPQSLSSGATDVADPANSNAKAQDPAHQSSQSPLLESAGDATKATDEGDDFSSFVEANTHESLPSKDAPGANPSHESPGHSLFDASHPNSNETTNQLNVAVKHPASISQKTKDDAQKLYDIAHAAAEAHRIHIAREAFLTACQAGSIAACHRYGWYLHQSGNIENAKQFYALSCKAGIGKSCNNLGSIFETKQNWEEARNYYSWSCLAKHPNGCNNLKRIRDLKPYTSLKEIPLKKKEDNIPLFVH